jgi:hypothetical protein
MSQHDYNLADQPGASFRTDLNNALAAIVSFNSGATEPATMFAYMMWADTTTGNLKIRNSANNAWVTIGPMGTANLGLLSSSAIGSTVQGYDATLAALAGTTVAANTMIYATGTDTFTTTSLTAAGRAILDDADATAQRATLGLVIGTDVQGFDANTVKKNVANTFTAVQTPATGTASVSTTSTFTFNPATHGQVCTVTLTNAITVTLAIQASSLVAGTTYRIKLKAGDTSARTFAKNSTIKVAGGSALPITSGATTTNSIDHLVFVALDASTAECVGGTADVR